MPLTAQSLTAYLQGEEGQRLTKVRRALIAILLKNHAPLSAKDIIAKLHARALSANKTTVYRQLATLEGYGLVRVVRLGDRSLRYELTHDNHHHHLVCLVCHKVEDISFEEDLARQEAIIKKNKKFTVIRHSLEFFGRCVICQKKYIYAKK